MVEDEDMSDQIGSETEGALTPDARILFEKNMDHFLDDTEEIEKIMSNHLKSVGIEPNLETVLSHVNGWMSGVIWHYYDVKYNRSLTKDEQKDLTNLLKRRAFELRNAFISLRIIE